MKFYIYFVLLVNLGILFNLAAGRVLINDDDEGKLYIDGELAEEKPHFSAQNIATQFGLWLEILYLMIDNYDVVVLFLVFLIVVLLSLWGCLKLTKSLMVKGFHKILRKNESVNNLKEKQLEMNPNTERAVTNINSPAFSDTVINSKTTVTSVEINKSNSLPDVISDNVTSSNSTPIISNSVTDSSLPTEKISVTVTELNHAHVINPDKKTSLNLTTQLTPNATTNLNPPTNIISAAVINLHPAPDKEKSETLTTQVFPNVSANLNPPMKIFSAAVTNLNLVPIISPDELERKPNIQRAVCNINSPALSDTVINSKTTVTSIEINKSNSLPDTISDNVTSSNSTPKISNSVTDSSLTTEKISVTVTDLNNAHVINPDKKTSLNLTTQIFPSVSANLDPPMKIFSAEVTNLNLVPIITPDENLTSEYVIPNSNSKSNPPNEIIYAAIKKPISIMEKIPDDFTSSNTLT